jgi:hypothetical protein
MTLFSGLTTDGLEETQDRLGGFQVLASGAYTGKIKAAYAGKSSNSASQNITVILEHAGGEYRETFWITNKNGENFFRNKQDNTKKIPLPGFAHIDDLCLMTTDKPLSGQVVEDKVMNVYDSEARKELPKSVPMLVELLGKEVTFGILKQIVFKQVKNAAGVYEDTTETREENVTDKIFHYPSNLTIPEAKAGSTVSSFYGAWVEKNKDVTRDRTTKGASAQGGKPGRPGSPPQATGGTAAKTTSLFGK